MNNDFITKITEILTLYTYSLYNWSANNINIIRN